MQVNQSTPLARDTLRQQARALLRQRLLEGHLPPGRINESQLSTEIGISRTPLREALLGLEQEGLLESTPGQGFYALPLSVQEVREIYPVLWTLEALALRLRPLPGAAELDELAAINERLEKSVADPLQALRYDTEWHAALLHPCANRRLLDTIAKLKQAAYRYEYAFMREARRVTISAGQHRQIIAALQNRDVAHAITRLEENWRVTLEVTDAWLTARDAPRHDR